MAENNTHGGFRQGSGRKKKSRDNQDYFESAEDYLAAVVSGLTPPDSIRVAAAKCLIAYQKTKARGVKKNPSVSELESLEQRDIETSRLLDFEKKASKIREKYKEEKNQ